MRLTRAVLNFAKKLSRHSNIREIRESFLSRKFLVIRYIGMGMVPGIIDVLGYDKRVNSPPLVL